MSESALIDLQLSNKSCKKCYLHQNCYQPISGQGTTRCSIMVVGDTPDMEDTIDGEPLAGLKRKILDKMFKGAGVEKSDIYYTLMVRCDSKSGYTESVRESCKSWIWGELKLVEPKVVFTLGRNPTIKLAGLHRNITLESVLGERLVVNYMKSPIIPLYDANKISMGGDKIYNKVINIIRKSIKETV